MRLRETPLPGLVVVEPERIADERGWFARTWCADELAAAGLDARAAQMNASFNERAGTLRGMHFQEAPYGEGKLVRATRGAIFDVAIDLRPDSPTHRRWFGAELTEENGLALLVPEGFAHGFVTLADATEVLYLMTTPFVEGAGRGVRYDDPAFGIEWPREPAVISERDRGYPDYTA